MQLDPYLSFNGQCETAFKFYEKVLGGKFEAVVPYEESPMAQQVPPERLSKITARPSQDRRRDADGLR